MGEYSARAAVLSGSRIISDEAVDELLSRMSKARLEQATGTGAGLVRSERVERHHLEYAANFWFGISDARLPKRCVRG